MIWFTLALFVISFLVVALLAPKPEIENARAQTLDDVSFPRATEDAPIPLVLGRVRMKAPNVTWYGNFRTIPIREKIKTGLFSSTTVTVAHRYFLTMDLALAMGPNVACREIYVDDKLAWSGDTGGGAVTAINNIGISFGGYKEGGAMNMGGFFYSGANDLVNQPVDSIIENQVGAGNVPAYLGTSHISLDGELGESAQLRKMAFILECYTNSLGLTNNGRIGVDMNPAEALYQILTDPWRGLGVSPSQIDVVTLTAIGEVLYTEGNGVSVQVTAEATGKKVVEEILRQIDGVAYQDPETGRIVFKLIRDDYDPDLLPIYDQDDILKVENFSRSGWDEVIAQVKISFKAREKDSDLVAISQDMATAGMIGRLRSTTLSMPFCYDPDLANRLASRERAQLSVPLFRMTLQMNRNANTLRPGDVFKVDWPDYGITGLVMRVQEFDFGSLLDGKIVVRCLQDNFALDTVVFAPPPESNWTAPVVSPQEIIVSDILEMPRFYMNRLQFPIADGNAGLVPLALQPSGASSGFDLLAGIASGNLDVREPQNIPYPAHGTLLAEYDRLAGFDGADVTGFDVINVSGDPDGFVAAGSLAELRQGELGIIYMGGEYIGFTSAVDNLDGSWTISNVYRGLLGTRPRTHAANTRVWQIRPDMFGQGTLDTLDEEGTLYYKLLDRVGPTAIDEADIAEASQVMQRWARRGQRVRDVRLDGARTGITIDNATGLASVSWKRSNREVSLISIESDADEVPDFSDADAELYDVQVYNNGILIGSLSNIAVSGTSVNVDFGTVTLAGPGEIRVTTRWDYPSPAVDLVNSNEYAFLPVTFDQILTGVNYKAAGTHIIDSGVTSINVPFPAGAINEGDLLLMFVMHRSSLTIPAGWIEVGEEIGPLNHIHILARRADGTEAGSQTITQSVSNRFIGQMIILEGFTGVPFPYIDVQGGATGVNANGTFNTGSLTTDYDVSFNWITVTNNLANSGGANTLLDAEAGYVEINPLSTDGNRLGIAYKEDQNIGDDDAVVQWTSDVTGSSEINWVTGFVIDPFDIKMFNYPNTPDGGFLWRFEHEFTFEDTGLTDPAEDTDPIRGIEDISQNSNNGTQGGSNQPIYDRPNRTAIFNRGNVERLESSVVPTAAGSFFARFRADTGVAGTQTFAGSANGSNRCWLSLTNGVASMGIGDLGSDIFQDVVDLRSATDWHTVVGTYSGGTAVLYVDGVQVATDTYGGTISNNAIYAGSRHTGAGVVDNGFDGEMLAVGFIDKALTAAEVERLHNYYELVQTS